MSDHYNHEHSLAAQRGRCGVLARYIGGADGQGDEYFFEAPMLFSRDRALELAQAVREFRQDQNQAPQLLIVEAVPDE